MFEPKRLHPITAVLSFFKQLKELFFPFMVFIFLGTRDNEGISSFVLVIGATGILLLLLIKGILSWYRFTYRIEDNELRIEYGLFVTKKRYIPFERIQSLDLSEGILHRPFQLVKVKVETAGSNGIEDAEGVLTAIKKEEAEAIQEIFAASKRMQKDKGLNETEIQVEDNIIYQATPKELFILASTSGGVGVVISAVLAFIFQFEEIIPYERVFKGLEEFVTSGLVFVSLVLFVGFLFAWIIALIATMIKYANFTVRKVGEDLVITRGLLERRQFTIPIKRIQAIRISENIVRQPIGYATVIVESAGGSSVNEESSKVVLLPVIKKSKIQALIEPFLTEYLFTDDFKTVPRRSFIRYLFRGWIYVIPLIIIPILIFKLWGLLSSILFLLVSSIWSYLKYKDAGWDIQQLQLSLRYRTLVKHTVFMKRYKIQSFSFRESYFQRKKKLATVEASVKSGLGGTGGTVIDLNKEDVLEIYKWYSSERRLSPTETNLDTETK
ncbi:PH domain-containing protein [Bacillus sp. 31A1R]|uniref:PH domain-containing protein n=1 Tax=Robertmurraya mangrovi TaxID=3098077 RepID=A0ABU5J5I8_9BACI|nr:PH domain-containing protein [Bacillus sp. 31A1R]MDZ5474586.1 PH domain-containing protein [Bacillus sp. 31A1R]